MTDAYLPVVTLDIPDDAYGQDFVDLNVPSPGMIVFAKQFSQYNMYITQPEGQLPWLIYADIGQHVHIPDVLLDSIPASDIVEECEESCKCGASVVAPPVDTDRLDPEWVLALVRTVNESAKGGML